MAGAADEKFTPSIGPVQEFTMTLRVLESNMGTSTAAGVKSISHEVQVLSTETLLDQAEAEQTPWALALL